jgi:uncharacterized radical SAM protein YgiQ
MQATIKADRSLFSYPKYWAHCYGTAPFLPMSRAEMDELGWDSCDIILVTGDAYVDHPSFGMAVIGRLLESHGFRVGIISQPDWHSKDDFMQLGEPNLYFGVTAGNMDSMINRYTADKKLRHDDAYTAGNIGGKRPDRAVTVYTQRCKEAYKHIPVVIGGIEASLRRIGHYDYWSEKIRRSVLFDSKADLLMFGNAERPLIEVTHRLAAGEDIKDITDVRGTGIIVKEALPEWQGVDSTSLEKLGKIDAIPSPYIMEPDCPSDVEKVDPKNDVTQTEQVITIQPQTIEKRKPWEKVYIKLPAYETVRDNKMLYAHTSRIFHQETNPGCARALMQRHGDRHIWLNPPAMPLETEEMDAVFGLPYQRIPHPVYGENKIPAYDMIKFSVNIMRGCFGGCTFCSITEHEGRIIQSRSHESIVNEIEDIKEKLPAFTGHISDLGGPTSNMYHLNCNDPDIQASCRKLSCVFPTICTNLNTDHSPTTQLYRKTRAIDGVHTVSIASGLRYDLAVEDPEYVKELVTHHVGGYLKIAPEHSEKGTLDKMMKPGMGTYDNFKRMFDKYSKEAGKKQYLIPYFIAAHPGSEDEDMLNLALWLKTNDFRPDQVQTFYPSPMSLATAMYHSDKNPLKQVTYKSEKLYTAKDYEQRRVQKGFLRYHDPKNWPALRQTLKDMGRTDLIGDGKNKLVPGEDKDPVNPRSPRKARPGQQTGASHTTNRPKLNKSGTGMKPASKKQASKKAKPSAKKAATNAKPTGKPGNRKPASKGKQQVSKKRG